MLCVEPCNIKPNNEFSITDRLIVLFDNCIACMRISSTKLSKSVA